MGSGVWVEWRWKRGDEVVGGGCCVELRRRGNFDGNRTYGYGKKRKDVVFCTKEEISMPDL